MGDNLPPMGIYNLPPMGGKLRAFGPSEVRRTPIWEFFSHMGEIPISRWTIIRPLT